MVSCFIWNNSRLGVNGFYDLTEESFDAMQQAAIEKYGFLCSTVNLFLYVGASVDCPIIEGIPETAETRIDVPASLQPKRTLHNSSYPRCTSIDQHELAAFMLWNCFLT